VPSSSGPAAPIPLRLSLTAQLSLCHAIELRKKAKKRLKFEVEMQYKAGTNCDNSISGPERKDGALGGYKVKTALNTEKQ